MLNNSQHSNSKEIFLKSGNRLLVFIIVITFLYACSPERKLAKSFAYSDSKRSALVFEPQFVFKTSLKEKLLDTLSVDKETRNDSVLLANTQLIEYIDDSMFIANYMTGLQQELRTFGFEVYDENSVSDFMEIDSSAYVIHVAQIEMEETFYINRDYVEYYNLVYFHDHILNAAYINSWIEISEVNVDNNNKIYFGRELVTDDFHGEFIQDLFTDKVKYMFEQDTLKYDDLYDFAYSIGRTYAAYTFDALLNKHLKDHLPPAKLSGKYWRYNPVHEHLFYAIDDKFILMEE